MAPPRRVKKGLLWDSEEAEVEGQEGKRPRRGGKGSVSDIEEEEKPPRGIKGWSKDEIMKLVTDEEYEEAFMRKLKNIPSFLSDLLDEGIEPLEMKGLFREGKRLATGGFPGWKFFPDDLFRNSGDPFKYGKTTSKFSREKRFPAGGFPGWKFLPDDPFRNPGDPFNYGKTTSKFNPSKEKLHMFVRSAESAVEHWNENHEGDDLELVLVVSGDAVRPMMAHGHFNFKAKPKGSKDDKDVRLLFAEVIIGSDRLPDVVSYITTCSELKAGSMINCCHRCEPRHEVYHPREFVPQNYDELSSIYRCISRRYGPDEYEKCPVKIA